MKTIRTGEGEFPPPKRRQEPRQDRSLPTQVRTNAKGRNPARNNRRRGCDHRPSRHNGATETPQEPNTPEQQEGPQTWDQTIPPQEQVKDNRDMKRRTNHEGQSRLQTSQRTGAVDTAGQKRTHPKARESKQGTSQPHRSREP